MRERGVDAGHWPAECKKLLGTPQNLTVFLLRLERRATGYRRDSTLATNLSGNRAERGLDFLTEAVCAAVQEWARREPAPFLAFLQAHQQSDNLFVQRLLCRGLRTIATTHPEEGLRFLTADPRRLVLGDLEDEHADTIALVSAIAPHLAPVQTARQVERPIEVEAWSVFARDLRDLRLCDPKRAERFLRRLFERYPGARDSLFGASLPTYVWWFLPQPTTRQMLQGMRDGGWRDGPQAYGELLAIRYLVFPGDHDAQQDLRQLLQPDGGQTEKSSRIRTGLAFTAAHLWRDVSHRAAATDILVRLIPLADRRVSQAIMHVFLRTDVLCADRDTECLLRTLHEHPTVLKGAQGSFFAERLQDLLSAYPDLVFDLCMDVARLWAEELDAPRVGFASSTAQFTNMALTFQRLDGAYRAKGLDLFERLLDIGVHDAFMTLQELDRRIPSLPAPVRRPIARPRPQRTSPT